MRRSSENPVVGAHYPDPHVKLLEIWLTHDFADACIIHAATGRPVVCSIRRRNLPAAARTFSSAFSSSRAVVLADPDPGVDVEQAVSDADAILVPRGDGAV